MLSVRSDHTAKTARCHQLLSEALNHGQDCDGEVLVNTFLSKPNAKSAFPTSALQSMNWTRFFPLKVPTGQLLKPCIMS